MVFCMMLGMYRTAHYFMHQDLQALPNTSHGHSTLPNVCSPCMKALGAPVLQPVYAPSPHLTSPPPATTSCQVIKRFIMHSKKTAFVVEHDFIMATYLADRVIVYEGQASKHATARTPQSLQSGRQGRGLYVQRGFSYRFSSKG
jgi:hypothetical protein